ncbi:MAG: hypothetical protein NT062_08685, partial [Proteobacteria bacterium]|nr:hypothetical protein [Pseudomonadota bacterium]
IAETVQIVGDVRVMVDVMNAVTSGPFTLEPVEPQAPATSPREAAPPETSPRLFLSVGSGIGNRWKTWRAQLGQRLTHGLHLVEELDSLGSVHTSSDTLEEFGSFGAGVRWTPFEPRPRPSPIPLASFIDVRAVYLTVVVGAAVRDRLTTTMTTSSEVIAWSPMASLAVGLLELQGHDWTLGPELRGQRARFDGRLMRDWQLMIALHLNQW